VGLPLVNIVDEPEAESSRDTADRARRGKTALILTQGA